MDLLDHLKEGGALARYPMHMPGHKRNTALCSMPNPYAFDVTEVEGTDNLYEPEEVLLTMQRRAARLWGSKTAHLLINGSTGGLLAAIRASTRAGDEILVARNCHQSVYHALMLCRLRPVYLLPQEVPGYSFCGAVRACEVEKALSAHPAIRTVVITSPTYEGICSDVAAIAEVVHRHGAVLIVDEAHGAHLGFDPHFPKSAVTQGADLVVQSLHKTLPALTQTALLHRCSDRVTAEALRRNLRIFGSSSPSYVLMASADQCFTLLERERKPLFSAYFERLRRFYQAASRWKRLHLLREEETGASFDPGKLVISCRGTNCTGTELARTLRERFFVETEMATLDTVLAMTSIADTDEGFHRLLSALDAIDQTLLPGEERASLPHQLPVRCLFPFEAEECPHESVSLRLAPGRICAELLRAYPPGIPVFAPGEVLTKELLEALCREQEAGIAMIGSEGDFPHTVRVCKRIDEA